MFDAPDQVTQTIPIRSCPIIKCPACGSLEITGNYNERRDSWSIECSSCGTGMEIQSVGTPLESACELVNRYEKLGYEVKMTKKIIKEEF